MKTRSIFFSILYLFVIQALTQWGGVMLAQCPNTPWNLWGAPGGYIGIQTTTPQRPLHIFSSNVCTEATIRLEYQGPYWGHLALINPYNVNSYSFVGLPSDMILQADDNAGNVLLTTRNKGKAIKFTTTPILDGVQQDRERFRISDDGYHTLIDLKVREMETLGNGLFRLQITDIASGNLKAGLGYNWKMGIDRVNNIFDTSGNFKFGNWLKFGCNKSPNDFSNTFDYSNTAITINPNNTIVLGNPGYNYIADGNVAKVSILNDDGTDMPALRVHRNLEGEYKQCLIDYVSTKANGIENPSFASTSNAFVVVNDLNELDWREVFAVKGNGDTHIHGQVIISDGSGNFIKQQDHLGARLFVEGTMVVQEIFVNSSNWSDFVFQENYLLPSLEDLENSINLNGHLPGIPSEKEVKEKGINVADMQSKLLQKIEELTLYVIELKKEINKLKSTKGHTNE